MLTLTNKIVGKEYVTPKDALLSMLSNHSLENDTCYDPDPDAVSEILTHAVSDDILIWCEFLRAVILFCTDMSVRWDFAYLLKKWHMWYVQIIRLG